MNLANLGLYESKLIYMLPGFPKKIGSEILYGCFTSFLLLIFIVISHLFNGYAYKLEVMIELIQHIKFVEVIEFIGTFAFAISGVRRAASKNYDWFGAFVLGFVTAVGGGTLRDLLLGNTPFWLLNSIYVWCTVLALVFFILLRDYLTHMNTFIFWCDSIGLGLFTVVGAEKAMVLGYEPWVMVAMGTITGVVGGIIRDIFLNESPLIFKQEIYAFSCIFGGSCFVLLNYIGLPLPIVSLATATIVVLLRAIAVRYKLELPKLKNEK